MSSKTMNDLWAEYKPRRVRGKKTEREIVRQYETYVAPRLGAKRLDKITFQTIDDMLQEMRHTPYQANRVLALLRTMYKFAVNGLRWVDYSPTSAVQAFPERKRKRHIRRGEAPKIAFEILTREEQAPVASLFLWLLIFTGARPKELKTARWSDLEGNVITLDQHKSINHTGLDRTIVLPPAAMEKLNKLAPPETRKPEDKIISISRPEHLWRAIRIDAECPDLRIYDLRHTFGSYALQSGFTLGQIGQSLNHMDPKTTAIYAELTNRNREKLAIDTSLAILHDMGITTTDGSEYIRALR